MAGWSMVGKLNHRAPLNWRQVSHFKRLRGRIAFSGEMAKMPAMTRCPWLPVQHALYVTYHDQEWGVPSRDPRYLFECICLEGAQAGLSW